MDKSLNPSQQEFYDNVLSLLWSDEEIVWAASPLKKRSIVLLSGNGNAAFIGAVITVFALVSAFFSILNNNSFALFSTLTFSILLFSLLDFWKIWNRSHTHYALSKDRLFIQVINKLKPKIYSLDIRDIKYFSIDKNKDNSGVIHIICHQHPNIYTLDLKSTETRIHPTLENIPSPERLVDLIIELKSKKENRY